MPCFLGQYENAATERKFKLERAIDSFLDQNYLKKEIIIVSDGCMETIDFINKNYKNEESIKLYFITKQPMFSGNVRQFGITMSNKNNLTTYIDSDDFYKRKYHLANIVRAFSKNPELDWVYFNDFVKYQAFDAAPLGERDAKLEYGSIGTSNIAHRNLQNISWKNCDGYGHDFTFIQKLIDNYPDSYTKISGCSYVTCHIPNACDS